MNYFNYFTEIEDTFIRRRGKHLFLSPMDWALIETWKGKGIPLHVALNGIEKAFDSYHSKPRHRSVKTLFYCEEEVEAQFAEWLESQLGAGDKPSEKEGSNGSSVEPSNGLPFPHEEILHHLNSVRDELLKLHKQRDKNDEFAETLLRVISRLETLRDDFASAARPNAEMLEASLTQLEEILNRELMNTLSPSELETLRVEAETQLRPYKNRMDKETYEQTLSNLLSKSMRERYAIPRLSLFYL
jgi:hypothetical protein